MLSNKESSELLFNYIEKKTKEIQNTALEHIAHGVSTAEITIKGIVESVLEQAEALDVLLPINLIELLANGGFVKSKNVTVEQDETKIYLTIHDRDIFYTRTNPRTELDAGDYRVTLIVEKLPVGKLHVKKA